MEPESQMKPAYPSLIGIYTVGSVGAKSPSLREDSLLCTRARVPEEGLRSRGKKKKKKKASFGEVFFLSSINCCLITGLKEGAFCDAVSDLFVRRRQGSSVWSLNRFRYTALEKQTLACRTELVHTSLSPLRLFLGHLSRFHTSVHVDVL